MPYLLYNRNNSKPRPLLLLLLQLLLLLLLLLLLWMLGVHDERDDGGIRRRWPLRRRDDGDDACRVTKVLS